MASGDETALAELMNRYTARIGTYALRLGGPTLAASDVDEAVADTFVNAWYLAGTYSADRGPVFAWLMHFARLRTLDVIRRVARRTRREEVLDEQDVAQPDTTVDVAEQVIARTARDEWLPTVREALAQLPASDQEILRQRFTEDRAPHEIAASLGVSANVVRVRLSRALARLKRVFDSLGTSEAATRD
jgi:RNA polymerase sigma-70 factor (ECF subfamily)